MRDTIDLLEIIGRNASMRHASAEELTQLLREAQASEALVSAVASGESSRLSTEFGDTAIQTPQISQAPCQEDDAPEEDTGGTLPSPDEPLPQ